MIKGAEVVSILKYVVTLEIFRSIGWLNNMRLKSAKSIEYPVMVGNRVFELSNKAEGIKRAVGITIFSILVSLRILYGRFRVFERWQLVEQDRYWLHRRIVLKVGWVIWQW